MAAVKLGFAGRVAVITGAGGGLGRAYALEFARRGASVVVNDLGCSPKGEGRGTQLADIVVKEITDAGGIAIANYDSVDNGENIIATAIKHFGKVDILINNAGILRDRSFINVSEEDWDKVFQVHVKGAFKVTKAAWPYMRGQKYGRIIMTTSSSGLYGNFGQANYSAAKLALLGLANTLVIEGRKANINVNTIAPVAETRMTVDIMGKSGNLKPEHIAPFVLYLCHESCTDSGSIIETGGGFASKIRLEKSQGAQLREFIGDNITVEKVAESWSQLTDFTVSSIPSSNIKATTNIMESIQKLPEALPLDVKGEQMRLYKFEDYVFVYTEDDAIKYALSIGAKLPADSHYLYEGHSEFSVIPTFPTIIAVNTMMQAIGSGVPGMEGVNLARVLHGEQYIELFKPLPTSGKLTVSTRIVDLLDKKKFCSLITENDIFDEYGEKLGMMQCISIFLGSGGIGSKQKTKAHILPISPPNRPPDATFEEKTASSQAALYRLNGDKNLVHIDPNVSSLMGFKIPILHGLCSYGFAVRHVLKTYANNDSSLFKAMKVQFSKPVTPGDTLITEMWCEGSRITFQTKVKKTGSVVLKGGYVDLIRVHKITPSLTKEDTAVSTETISVSQNETAKSESNDVDETLKATKIMEEIKMKLKEQPELAGKAKGKILFQITKKNQLAGEWLLNFDEKPTVVLYGPQSIKPSATVKIEDGDFEKLATGKLNQMQAFMSGKIKISGNAMLVQNLDNIFKNTKSKI